MTINSRFGCRRCHALHQTTLAAVEQLGWDTDVEKCHDYLEMAASGGDEHASAGGRWAGGDVGERAVGRSGSRTARIGDPMTAIEPILTP